jgi:hypothetical protein
MKFRFHDNSVRVRLTRSEVQQLAHAESVESCVYLAPVPLRFALVASKDCKSPVIQFQDGLLSINIPLTSAINLAATDQIGIDAEVKTAGWTPVQLLIEKDFKCLHGVSEDQEDCFTNPHADAPKPASA